MIIAELSRLPEWMLNGTCEMFQELADSLGDPILSAFAEYMAAAYIQCGFRRAHESTVRTMPSTARPTPEESPLFTGSVLSDMRLVIQTLTSPSEAAWLLTHQHRALQR